MVMVLNVITWIGIVLGCSFDFLGKKVAVFQKATVLPMAIALLSQLVLLALVIFVGVVMHNEGTETASLVSDIISSPRECYEVLKSMN